MTGFRQTSPCTWEWNGYQIVKQIGGFGIEQFFCRLPSAGLAVTEHTERTQSAAELWCQKHANPIPETDFPTHCDMTR